MPWRNTRNPYCILVSEIMLQQTQVAAVLKKYPSFIKKFPDMKALARAPLSSVLREWQGLGYNRRAVALKKIVEIVLQNHKGRLPHSTEELDALPGIGHATASSIAAFAFNAPAVFIETNIRRVFIHYFFPKSRLISDARILPLVKQTLDTKNPREWYWALMDYGAWLSQAGPNPNRRSRHYLRQSTFGGSHRELRGLILKLLLQKKRTHAELARLTRRSPAETKRALAALKREGFISDTRNRWALSR